MLPPGATLALKWGGVSWAVCIFHENAHPVGSTTLPREWTWPMICGWVLGSVWWETQVPLWYTGSQHPDSASSCAPPSIAAPGSHTSLGGYRLNRTTSRDWKLGPCGHPRIYSFRGGFEPWSPLWLSCVFARFCALALCTSPWSITLHRAS